MSTSSTLQSSQQQQQQAVTMEEQESSVVGKVTDESNNTTNPQQQQPLSKSRSPSQTKLTMTLGRRSSKSRRGSGGGSGGTGGSAGSSGSRSNSVIETANERDKEKDRFLPDLKSGAAGTGAGGGGGGSVGEVSGSGKKVAGGVGASSSSSVGLGLGDGNIHGGSSGEHFGFLPNLAVAGSVGGAGRAAGSKIKVSGKDHKGGVGGARKMNSEDDPVAKTVDMSGGLEIGGKHKLMTTAPKRVVRSDDDQGGDNASKQTPPSISRISSPRKIMANNSGLVNFNDASFLEEAERSTLEAQAQARKAAAAAATAAATGSPTNGESEKTDANTRRISAVQSPAPTVVSAASTKTRGGRDFMDFGNLDSVKESLQEEKAHAAISARPTAVWKREWEHLLLKKKGPGGAGSSAGPRVGSPRKRMDSADWGYRHSNVGKHPDLMLVGNLDDGESQQWTWNGRILERKILEKYAEMNGTDLEGMFGRGVTPDPFLLHKRHEDDADGNDDDDGEEGYYHRGGWDGEKERRVSRRYGGMLDGDEKVKKNKGLYSNLVADVPMPSERESRERAILHRLHPEVVSKYADLRRVLHWAPNGTKLPAVMDPRNWQKMVIPTTPIHSVPSTAAEKTKASSGSKGDSIGVELGVETGQTQDSKVSVMTLEIPGYDAPLDGAVPVTSVSLLTTTTSAAGETTAESISATAVSQIAARVFKVSTNLVPPAFNQHISLDPAPLCLPLAPALLPKLHRRKPGARERDSRAEHSLAGAERENEGAGEHGNEGESAGGVGYSGANMHYTTSEWERMEKKTFNALRDEHGRMASARSHRAQARMRILHDVLLANWLVANKSARLAAEYLGFTVSARMSMKTLHHNAEVGRHGKVVGSTSSGGKRKSPRSKSASASGSRPKQRTGENSQQGELSISSSREQDLALQKKEGAEEKVDMLPEAVVFPAPLGPLVPIEIRMAIANDSRRGSQAEGEIPSSEVNEESKVDGDRGGQKRNLDEDGNEIVDPDSGGAGMDVVTRRLLFTPFDGTAKPVAWEYGDVSVVSSWNDEDARKSEVKTPFTVSTGTANLNGEVEPASKDSKSSGAGSVVASDDGVIAGAAGSKGSSKGGSSRTSVRLRPDDKSENSAIASN
ncbi:hypothetical protein HDU76_005874 [Blyttiomyces sp. JEL0837]|nr:hypothetical protein HDU76_005874 [Blyttiomyces sp. JEL0837]